MSTPSDADLRDQAAALAARLLAAGRTLVTAESCTAGWIAKACTDLPGSSRWFLGGVVAYANEAKSKLLNVPATTLEAHGAVSEPVVRAMALGALARVGGDVAVAVSGVAGPDGGTPAKPVGTVWLAWARRDATTGQCEVATACELFPGDRDAVRRLAVQRALAGVLE
jgi:nicotinamide-nucleotide amidase